MAAFNFERAFVVSHKDFDSHFLCEFRVTTLPIAVRVKSALNRSSGEQGTRLKDIAPAISGVYFLGTHRGSKSATLGKSLAYQTTVAATRRNFCWVLNGIRQNWS